MKTLIALALGCVLTASVALAGQPSEADAKWLEAVQKMVAKGQNQVSTPVEKRVDLVKEWAGKNGYRVQVNKTGSSYRLELSKSLAQK